MLGNMGEDQVGRDRRHLVQPRLAELALDVVFARESVAAVELQAGVGRLPCRIRGQHLRHIGFRAAIEAGADAVYFGLTHFTARAKVGFGLPELPEAMRALIRSLNR